MKKDITLIIGKTSNLSIHLQKSITNSVLISTLDNEDQFDRLDLKDKKVNIIFNQFQKSTQLNNLDCPINYIQRSIDSTSNILSYMKNNAIKINKIIYTSSSSVYGDNTNSHEYDNLNPKSLHASLKIANEKLIEKFSKDNSINFTITRVFNMYGGNDDFSIVSKIISAYKNNSTLPLINNGEAIRDFIHIEDVVAIYNKLMSLDNAPIVNIGTGIGRSVLFLLTFLKQHDMNIKTSSTSRDELKVSISNNELLLKIYKKNSFINLEENILKTLMEIK